MAGRHNCLERRNWNAGGVSKHVLQFDWKQWMGDAQVLAMDWDARGMHHWLIGVSLQQEPPGSLPDDMAAIRRWLNFPPDELWRRVKPQIFAAWSLQDGRWFQKGTVRAHRERARLSERGKAGAAASRGLAPASPTLLRGFQVPSVSEVKSYCQERKNRVNPQAFVDFYSSKGWKVGSAPMKDWRAAVRNWEHRDGFAPADEKQAQVEAKTECWGHKNKMIPVSLALKNGGHCSAECRDSYRKRLEEERRATA